MPFETLSLNDSGTNINTSEATEETQLLLVNDAKQAMALEPMVNPEDFARLQTVDYAHYAVIALFRGRQESNNYQTVIQQIVSEDNHLIVEADFWAPSPYYASTTALTYPYHLIKISRANLPAAQVMLQLAPTFITPTPPVAVNVPFETLSLNETGEGVSDRSLTDQLQLLLLNDAAQVMAVEVMVSPDDFKQLQKVDYKRYAVIGLFRGIQGSSNYQTVIQALVHENDRLIVKAELWAPSPYYTSTAALTYPYHLIQIAKADLPNSEVVLQLDPTFVTPTPPAK